MNAREKYLERQRRYNHSEKGRERWRRYENRRYAEDAHYRFAKQMRALMRSLEARKALRIADDLAAGIEPLAFDSYMLTRPWMTA